MRGILFVCSVSIVIQLTGTFQIKTENAERHAALRRSLNRQERFWGVGVVRFENSACYTLDGVWGTCLTRRQCAWTPGGVRAGPCASGIGVCCVVQATCGNTTYTNNTYFVNPNFPISYAGGSSCVITINPCPGVCQLRIEFLSLTLAQPNANGTCLTDAMYVLGGASVVPIICGENSGLHIYVDFIDQQPIQIIIDTNSAIAFNRLWNLKLIQIGCDCPTRAPAGCLMYYTALTGVVTSFNYGTTISGAIVTPTNATGTRELANLNYGVCIEMQPGYCSIQWTQAGTNLYAFAVSGDTIMASAPAGTVGTAAASMIGAACTTDFVVIPNPSYINGSAVNSDRFCGNGFPGVTTGSKPFVLTVVTNADEVTDAGNRGFSLAYSQQRCTSSLLFR